MNELRGAHARALALAGGAVAAVKTEQLDLPTPCAGWTLRALLEHVIGQNHGFAEAARGRGADLAAWADRPFGTQPAAAFRRSAEELTEAFADAEAPFHLAEIRDDGFPARQAIGFHLLDTLIHGWDIAVSIGEPFSCPESDARLLLAIAEKVPVNRPPGAPFAPVLPHAGENGPFDRALTLLGRDPNWGRTH